MAEANVKNIESLELFLDAIVSLRTGTRKQADEIREQLQRVSNWLEKELPDYWRNQHRIAENKWIAAREELMRCESKTRAEDERSCSVQRKMLAKATERRALCEHRVRTIPQLSLQWNQFYQEISLSVRHLDDLSESTLQNAISRLQSIVDTLKKYLEL
ncbi:MAG: hypothetical protein NTY42_02435 [Planctomycetota bacterium]|nr:hypothetical protein [Planctomycetota bacterium]